MNIDGTSVPSLATRAAYAFALAAAAVLMTISSASAKSAKGEALWVVNRSGDYVAEFANATLATSGAPMPNRINTSSALDSPWGVVFDKSKNLWISNVGNGTLTKFTLSQLKALNTNDAPAPQVVISGLARPEGMAFDKHHNLWVANEDNGKLLEFTPKQLKSTGSPVPNITLSSADLSSPVGIVFDKKGNIWVGDDDLNHVAMFTAAQLKAGGTQSATVIISDDGSGSMDSPEPVAFDALGSLWLANNTDPVHHRGSVVKFRSDQLTTSGSPTPAVILSETTVTSTTADSFDVPTGLAFDKQGDLWVANMDSDLHGSVEKFAAADLSTSGSPQPAVFLDSNSGATNLDGPFMISFGPVLP